MMTKWIDDFGRGLVISKLRRCVEGGSAGRGLCVQSADSCCAVET